MRTNTTIPVDLGHPLVQGDARRLDVLLSELRRTCLITTLRSLAPERRASFILLHVLGLSVEYHARRAQKQFLSSKALAFMLSQKRP